MILFRIGIFHRKFHQFGANFCILRTYVMEAYGQPRSSVIYGDSLRDYSDRQSQSTQSSLEGDEIITPRHSNEISSSLRTSTNPLMNSLITNHRPAYLALDYPHHIHHYPEHSSLQDNLRILAGIDRVLDRLSSISLSPSPHHRRSYMAEGAGRIDAVDGLEIIEGYSSTIHRKSEEMLSKLDQIVEKLSLLSHQQTTGQNTAGQTKEVYVVKDGLQENDLAIIQSLREDKIEILRKLDKVLEQNDFHPPPLTEKQNLATATKVIDAVETASMEINSTAIESSIKLSQVLEIVSLLDPAKPNDLFYGFQEILAMQKRMELQLLRKMYAIKDSTHAFEEEQRKQKRSCLCHKKSLDGQIYNWYENPENQNCSKFCLIQHGRSLENLLKKYGASNHKFSSEVLLFIGQMMPCLENDNAEKMKQILDNDISKNYIATQNSLYKLLIYLGCFWYAFDCVKLLLQHLGIAARDASSIIPLSEKIDSGPNKHKGSKSHSKKRAPQRPTDQEAYHLTIFLYI